MIQRDRVLSHEIHPLKLLVDWASGVAAAYLFWRHALAAALVVGLVPPPVASGLVLRWASLEHYAHSRPGRYIKRYMTRAMELLRLGGAVVVWIGAWYRSWPAVSAGVLVILLAWARGLIWPARS